MSVLDQVESGHSPNVDDIVQHPDGYFLFGTNNGIYRFDKFNKSNKFYSVTDSSGSLVINTMEFIANNNEVLLGTNRGIYLLSLYDGAVSRWSVFEFLNTERIYDFHKENHYLYVATSAGFHRVDISLGSSSASIKSYYNNVADLSSLGSNHVLSIYKDRNGALWLSTLNGVSLFDSHLQKFNHYSVKGTGQKFSSSGEVFGLLSDKKGNLWVGTSNGVNVINHALNSSKTLLNMSGRVCAFEEDSSGGIWIGGAKGLFVYEAKEAKLNHITKDVNGRQFLDGASVHALLIDRDENLWIGSTWGLHSYSLRTKKVISYYNDRKNEASLSDNQIYSLHEDDVGNIWVGTLNGLNKLNRKSGLIKRYFPEEKLDQKQLFWVFSIANKKNHGFWLGTADGLYSFDSKSEAFKRFGGEHGLYNENVFGVIVGQQGDVWVSTNNGLARFDSKTERFSVFGASFGLQNQEFNFCAHEKLKDGRIVFGGINGLNIFNENEVASLLAIRLRAPTITNISTLDRNNNRKEMFNNYQANNKVLFRVNWSDTLVSIQFSALDYLFSKDVVYRYKLSGYDSDWVYLPSGQSNSTYTNLDSGQYVFEVQAKIGSASWSESQKMNLAVSSPPWSTPLAYSIYIVCPLFLLLFYLWRKNIALKKLKLNILGATSEITRQKLELESVNKDLAFALQAKDKFYKKLTHELRTPLTLIKSPLEFLLSGIQETQSRYWLGIIKHNSTELASMVDNLLALSSAQQEANPNDLGADVKVLCQELVDHFANLANDKCISLALLDDGENSYVLCSSGDVKIILSNLILNAIKYTNKHGSISIDLNQKDKSLIVTVCDSGIGISEADQKRLFNEFQRGADPRVSGIAGSGLGLAVVKSLVEKASGSICVESALNQGSKFILSLPLMMTNKVIARSSEYSADEIVISPYQGDCFVILIVEDNIEINALICEMFSDIHKCIPAFNFSQGVELLNTMSPDLVITDLMLSDEQYSLSDTNGGVEFCRLIKGNESLHHIPVIMLTALAEKNSQLYGLSQGADDYICKPFDTRDLLLRVNNRLQQLSNSKRYFSGRVVGVDNHQGAAIESPYFSNLAEKIKIEFENNFHDPEYGIEDLADVMAKTSRTLQTYFKKMDTTFGALLLDFRMNKAKEKIRQGRPIGLTAIECGINDASRFSSVYKKKFGLSPSEDKSKTY